MKSKVWLIATFMVVSVLWFLPDVVDRLNRKPDDAWARIQQTHVIRIAINPAYMPFDGLGSQGDFFGIDVDIAKEIAHRLGTRAEFVVAGNDSLYDVLRVGQADATISALPIEPAKIGLWAYSEPYFEAGQVMIERVRPARSSQDALQQSAANKTWQVSSLAVEYGSAADAAARALARRRAGVEVRYFDTPEGALRAVSSGAVDAAMVDGVSAQQLLPHYPGLHVAEQVTHDPYAIAVWGNNVQLLDAINAALADMQRDGTTQRIVEGWMRR